jgi:hypothetical protein
MEAKTPSQTEHKKLKERDMKIFDTDYHEFSIKTVELEHGTNKHTGSPSTSFLRPKNWRDLLTTQLEENKDSLWFPEYCIPDLHRRVFRESGTKDFAKELFKKTGTTELYSRMSKIAGMKGKRLFAADIANTNMFEVHDYSTVHLFGKYPDKNPDKIKEAELSDKHRSPSDARRLLLARGIMQIVLKSRKSILHINAPVHAIRVDNYIKRQAVWETKTKSISEPKDMHRNSPPEELAKMARYSRYFGLDKNVREYQPILPPVAYEIDLLANEPEIDTKKLNTLLNQYLTHEPKTKKGKEVFNRIKIFQEFLKNEDEKGVKAAAGRILTDKFGWKLVKKHFIY